MIKGDRQFENHPIQKRFPRLYQCLLLSLGCVLALSGCTRSQYRASADKKSYSLIASRLVDLRWSLPTRTVEPRPQSRMGLPSDLDCSPKPPDDPAAVRLMNCPDGHCNTKYWSKIPTASQIESPAWLEYLPRNDDGQIDLTQELAVGSRSRNTVHGHRIRPWRKPSFAGDGSIGVGPKVGGRWPVCNQYSQLVFLGFWYQ